MSSSLDAISSTKLVDVGPLDASSFAHRLVPHTCRILACRNASSANLQRLTTVTAQHHAIKYMIGFVHAGDYRLRLWRLVKANPLGTDRVSVTKSFVTETLARLRCRDASDSGVGDSGHKANKRIAANQISAHIQQLQK
jgi:hypothetical protein